MPGITKTVNKSKAAPGDTLTYSVQICNPSATDTTTIDRITDILPAGFVYAGLAPGNGIQAAELSALPAAGATGTLQFVGGVLLGGSKTIRIAPNSCRTLVYRVAILANYANYGVRNNAAVYRIGVYTSDTAKAYVYIDKNNATPDINQTLMNRPVSGSVATNDVFYPGPTYTVLGSPANGTLSWNVNGTYTYTPNVNFIGRDSVSYVLCSPGSASICDTASLTIKVHHPFTNQMNEALSQDDIATTLMATPVNVSVRCNDSDPHGHTLANPTIVSGPSGGSVLVNANGTITYTPNANFRGRDRFRYSVCDNGAPQACTEATLYLLFSALQSPVPVVLSHFNATAGDCAATLSWTTAQEINVSHFEIERMNAAGQFELLARVDAKGGNLPTKYNYDDRNAARGNRTYRLRMVDIDGQFACSPAQTVFVNCHDIRLYPNPSVSDPSLSISTSDDVTFSIKMVDGTGRMLFERSLSLKNESRIIQLPVEHLADGIYSVLVNDGSQTKVIRYQKTSK